MLEVVKSWPVILYFHVHAIVLQKRDILLKDDAYATIHHYQN
jgi:hypothetical protein